MALTKLQSQSIDTNITVAGVVTASSFISTSLSVSGVSTLGNVKIGTGNTTLIVEGDARITGILTIGTSSITFDGLNNEINLGAGVTITTSEILIGGNSINSTDLVVENINASGVITASSFVGDGSGLTGAGSTVVDDTSTNETLYPVLTAQTSGTITSSKVSTTKLSFNPSTGVVSGTGFSGSGANLTSLNASELSSGLVPALRITETSPLTVNGDLYVTGNISFGGTTTQLNTSQITFSDPDIILGVGTTSTFNPTDNTANHGGIAVASTEGYPLVNLNIEPTEVLPTTYKKFMWFKSNTAGLGTDAWLLNYAVGIGSTQFPTGTRLAAGNIHFSEDDLKIVRDINASGVVTATSFSGSLALGNVTGLGANVATFLATPSSANLASAVTDETGSGALVFATSPSLTTPNIGVATGTSLSVTGQLTSTVATGTAPLVVSSTTLVSNLNADLLDGEHLVDNASTANSIVGRDASGNITANRFISTVATGTAPLTVSSTTVVTNLNADLLDGENLVDNAATANTVVGRDASGNITAAAFVKSSGTSSQFLKADGSVDSNVYITSSSVGNGTLTLAVSGTGLSGSASFTANQSGNTTFTVTSNATSANTGSTIVARDASGNFSAGTITATLSGNASGLTGYSGTYWTSNNDGSGSGLDADTVDGIDSSRIVYGDNATRTSFNGNFNSALPSGHWDHNAATGAPGATWYHLINNRHNNASNNYQMQFAGEFFNANNLFYRIIDNNTPSAWRRIFHSGNSSGAGTDMGTSHNGYGTRTVQAGGSASGGSDGDIYYIY